MGMENAVTLPAPAVLPVPAGDAGAEIARLAARYRAAGGGVMGLVNGFGTRLEERMQALPAPVRARLDSVVRGALEGAYGVARRSPALPARGHVALACASGAAGGAGGLATALAELPFTVTLILHGIQDVAGGHGFDPAGEATRREVLRIFGSGGPLRSDDGVDSAFLGARLTLTGPAIQRMISLAAPRVAAALGPKLAAQSVPVLGALAGAGLNAAFLGYYREMAHVRFGLLTLAARHDPVAVMAAFRAAAEPPGIVKGPES
ncbi:MAG: EcsC family protein [Gemmobacter sp.]